MGNTVGVFFEGKGHRVHPDLFSRGPWGTGSARLSVVTLKRREPVSVEVKRNGKHDFEIKSTLKKKA